MNLGARVLHLINGEHYAGAERVQDLLAQRLPEFGFGVDFACLKPGAFLRQLKVRSANVFPLPMRSRLDLSPVLKLARLIRENGYGLLHTHTPRTALLGGCAAALAGVPMVHHVHSPTQRDSERRLQNTLNTVAEHFGLRRAARLIAVSESLRAYLLQRGVAPGDVRVVKNGVPARDVLSYRQTPRSPFCIGSVALFRPRKGTEVLLHAFAALRHSGLEGRLRMVGGFVSAGYERRLKDLATKLDVADNVDWLGFSERVQGELASMDLLVLPSLYGEGLPMVVLEAMAAGVPVVATAVEGVPEAIRQGSEGLLVAPGDTAALAEAIDGLLLGRWDWQGMRERAYRRQSGQFSDISMAAGVAGIYREILARISRHGS